MVRYWSCLEILPPWVTIIWGFSLFLTVGWNQVEGYGNFWHGIGRARICLLTLKLWSGNVLWKSWVGEDLSQHPETEIVQPVLLPVLFSHTGMGGVSFSHVHTLLPLWHLTWQIFRKREISFFFSACLRDKTLNINEFKESFIWSCISVFTKNAEL